MARANYNAACSRLHRHACLKPTGVLLWNNHCTPHPMVSIQPLSCKGNVRSHAHVMITECTRMQTPTRCKACIPNAQRNCYTTEPPKVLPARMGLAPRPSVLNGIELAPLNTASQAARADRGPELDDPKCTLLHIDFHDRQAVDGPFAAPALLPFAQLFFCWLQAHREHFVVFPRARLKGQRLMVSSRLRQF
eukprot:7865994-Alexandrium_andersonii.AAC.1